MGIVHGDLLVYRDGVEIFMLIYIYIGCGPLPVTVANESLEESPTKHVIILVVTVTVRGLHLM